MSTGRRGRDDDERREAIAQADAGCEAWRAAMRAQHAASPDHGDFYQLAANLYDTLDALATLSRVLVGQVRGYAAGQPAGSVVYDDSRGSAGAVHLAVRLGLAEGELEQLALELDTAGRRAMDFRAAIGHIGVEDVSRERRGGAG